MSRRKANLTNTDWKRGDDGKIRRHYRGYSLTLFQKAETASRVCIRVAAPGVPAFFSGKPYQTEEKAMAAAIKFIEAQIDAQKEVKS